MSGQWNHIDAKKSLRSEKYRDDFSEADMVLFNRDDEKAFEKLYNLLFSPVYFFAKKMMDGGVEADDITVDAFYKLWKLESKNFSGVEKIKTFLQVTVRNAALNERRNKDLRKEKAKIVFLAQHMVDETMHADITAELLSLVLREIEKLPPKAKKIFRLFYIEGIKEKQIARDLQISENTVRNHKAKALAFLRLSCRKKIACIIFLLIYFYGQ
jgi:RNA polymerase sigma-19 factor, ECF subfamily